MSVAAMDLGTTDPRGSAALGGEIEPWVSEPVGAQARALVLDLAPESSASLQLRAVLADAPRLETEVLESALQLHLDNIRDAEQPQVIFLVLTPDTLEAASGLLRQLRERSEDTFSPETPVLVVVDRVEPDQVLTLLQEGASDFLTLPLSREDLLPRLWRTLRPLSARTLTIRRLKETLGLKQLVGESPAFVEAIRTIPLIAGCDAAVLIGGETGTGKEVCARAVHYLSQRSEKPFVPVNCGAIPVELAENELFGHEKDAFTGASSSRQGLIAEADGGTLFLDEIDSLPLLVQVKLLRFLQEKEYRPLGSTRARKADIRILAASNCDLERSVEEGRFRADLYYRISTLPLALPPLRERQGDVALLARHFLNKHGRKLGSEVSDFSPAALQKLVLYRWPGNVRELENAVERAVVLSQGARRVSSSVIRLPRTAKEVESFRQAKARAVGDFERRYLTQTLEIHQGNITRAAAAAGKNRRAFWELLRKHQIDVDQFKN